MFARFVCAFLDFRAHEFHAKSTPPPGHLLLTKGCMHPLNNVMYWMMEMIRQNLYWPIMIKFTRTEVQKCALCQQIKKVNKKDKSTPILED